MGGSIQINQTIYSFEELSEFNGFTKLNIDLNNLQHFIKSWIQGSSYFQLQTSGSTGQAKIISVSRQQMIASSLMTGQALDLKKGDSALLCLNPNYIGGKMMLVRAMQLGLNLTVIPHVSNPVAEFEDIRQFDFAALVPLQVKALLTTNKGRLLLGSIKNIIVGGAAVEEGLISELQKVKANIFSTYGMTETVSHIALKKLNGDNKSDLFEVLEGVEIALDAHDCLRIKSAVTNNEWISTNDIVDLKGDQSFKWIGRIDNVINSGGVKIQLEQLEMRIQELLPSVNFMISSLKDSQFGEIVVMLTEANELTSKQTVLLKELLPKYHCPKAFLVIDQLPTTQSGKPDRQKAKDMVIALA